MEVKMSAVVERADGARRHLSRALDRAFCKLVEAAGKGNLTAMLRQ